MGSATPDPYVARRARELKPGEVLVAVEASGLTNEKNAEIIAHRHGGQIANPVLRRTP